MAPLDLDKDRAWAVAVLDRTGGGICEFHPTDVDVGSEIALDDVAVSFHGSDHRQQCGKRNGRPGHRRERFSRVPLDAPLKITAVSAQIWLSGPSILPKTHS